MRIKRVMSVSVIVILSLGLITGMIWALDFFAVINVSGTAQKIPVIGKIFPEKDKSKIKKPVIADPAQEENKILRTDKEKLNAEISELKKSIGDLEKKIEVVNSEKQTLLDTKNNLQAALDSLEASKDREASAAVNFEKLSGYYAEMKPEVAVKIMVNLSDEFNIGILQNLEDDQVAKILSAMDPAKAATLVDKMNR